MSSKFVQMVASPTLIGEIIAKDNLKIVNLMQTFENLLLQNYSTQFLDITYKINSLWVCVIKVLFKWWCHLYCRRNNSQRQFEHRKFDANSLQ